MVLLLLVTMQAEELAEQIFRVITDSLKESTTGLRIMASSKRCCTKRPEQTKLQTMALREKHTRNQQNKQNPDHENADRGYAEATGTDNAQMWKNWLE